MIRKVPIIDSSARPMDIASALTRAFDPSVPKQFAEEMARFTDSRYVCLTDSGIAAFYIILKALSASSSKTEVVLPAYTAGSLVVAVRKAGLKPVLCDISKADLNAGVESLLDAVSERTLAVACIHMFGIGMAGIAGLRQKLPIDVTLIEDCCQSMGSNIGGRAVGKFGDVSFFSFNRGKNMSVCGGGCITTNNDEIWRAVSSATKRLSKDASAIRLSTLIKVSGLMAVTNPYIYGATHMLAARFKADAPPRDFTVGGMEVFQAALGLSILKRFQLSAAKRHENGAFLASRLKELGTVTVPSVAPGDNAVFNRLPVVFADAYRVRAAMENLWRSGIESSRLYLRPLHHMFDLGYPKKDFPNASYVAERLVTLPVHPSVRQHDLPTMVESIREALR